MKVSRILVPTDFSAGADAALACAHALALRLGASVHVLHLVETGFAAGAWSSEIYTAEIGNLHANLVRDMAERLQAYVAPFNRETAIVTSDVEAGRPASSIVRVARARGADLIVMGTHGRTGLPHLLLGSVAERVVRTAPCPVLTVRTGWTPVGSIVLATDFGAAAEQALERAVRLATDLGAVLHLVHVVEDPLLVSGEGYVAPLPEIRDALVKDTQQRLDTMERSIPGLRVTSEVLVGQPAAAITDAASRRHADWIVMGTHGRGGVAHFLMGSTAERVIRTAPCPVLAVRVTEERARLEQSATSGAHA